MRLANIACLDLLMDLAEVGVVAPIKANLKLDASLVYSGQRLIDPLQVEVDGLLAENVLARCGGLLDDFGVGIGRRTDDDRVDLAALENLVIVRVGGRHVKPRRHVPGSILLYVGNGRDPRAGDA